MGVARSKGIFPCRQIAPDFRKANLIEIIPLVQLSDQDSRSQNKYGPYYMEQNDASSVPLTLSSQKGISHPRPLVYDSGTCQACEVEFFHAALRFTAPIWW